MSSSSLPAGGNEFRRLQVQGVAIGTQNGSVLLGSDVLFDRQLLAGRTIGLVSNPASIDSSFRHVTERAERAKALALS